MTTTAPKERPILLSGPEVRAYLDGRKTQARVPVQPQPPGRFGTGDVAVITNGSGFAWSRNPLQDDREAWPPDPDPGLTCPYGVPGDRLWCAERHWFCRLPHMDHRIHVCFDDEAGATQIPLVHEEWAASRLGYWRDAASMPRWACRLVLEVVAVRVERLLSISDEDARAEGYSGASAFLEGHWVQSLSDADPWLWVGEFKRIDQSAP